MEWKKPGIGIGIGIGIGMEKIRLRTSLIEVTWCEADIVFFGKSVKVNDGGKQDWAVSLCKRICWYHTEFIRLSV